MDTSLKKELETVSKLITQTIAEDTFPSGISPECLASAVRAYPIHGGKRIRPALLLWSCGALGGFPDSALYAAAAVEIYHSWTLVHDDIIDEDDLRRGLNTSHVELAVHAKKAYRKDRGTCAKFGRDFAILAGDMQQAWSFAMLLRSAEKGVPPELVLKLVSALVLTVNRRLISGEALDVEFPMRKLETIRPEEVMKMIAGKTSCLLQFAAQCGGAIALNSADFSCEPLAALGAYAENLGIAFQLRDDYLGLFGDIRKFGKPLGSDFHEGKPTPLYLEAMHRLSEAGKKRLQELTGLPEYPPEIIDELRAMMRDCGAEDTLLRQTESFTERAADALSLLPQNRYTGLLSALLDYLLARTV